MSDSATLQQMLTNLQAQITTVSNMAGQMTNPNSLPAYAHLLGQVQVPVPPQAPAVPNIEAMIRQAVDAKFAALSHGQGGVLPGVLSAPEADGAVDGGVIDAPRLAAPVPTPQPAPQPQAAQATPSMGDFIMPLLGAAFSKEQQMWLSQPKNLFGLMTYFSTPEGKGILQGTLLSYQEYLKGLSTQSAPALTNS